MGQKKLLRFAQIKTFSNVLEYPSDMPGRWKDQFKNQQPIVLELACGRGEYTVGLSKLFPEQNFIGVDIKGNRMYLGAKTAIDQSLTNAAFLRTQIEMIADYFERGEVKEIWITFPDPQLRTSKAKKRLTHPRFLRLYQRILAPGGIIHLKTDSPALYQFTLTVINEYGLTLVTQNEDVYKEKDVDPRLLIKTHYEGLDIAQSNKIFYLSFTLPNEIPDKDEWLQELLKQTEQSVG
jgi:tRNA (guanine-N7-)-methyltransferase